ncbi:MAG: glycosyltransferase [Chitinivibrionales bacterium]|nr:glycosyltransferase [Chitinivibrionales bacterium]MBD3358738.1 glycosyltransferase [Chitinivibrionales bacterium]
MIKILFLVQSSIVRGQAHVERYIAQALRRHERVILREIDMITEVRRAGVSGADRAEVMSGYRDYLQDEIIRWKPDCLLVLSGYAVDELFPGFFHCLREHGVPIAAWHADDPYYIDIQAKIASAFQWIFTVERAAVDLWRTIVPQTHFLPFGFSADLRHQLDRWPSEKYASQICFIGAPFRGSRRVSVIDRNASFLRGFKCRIMGATQTDTWRASLRNYEDLRHCVVDSFVDPTESMRYYAAAAVNLNLHKDSHGHCWDHNCRRIEATSPNERFFAIAGTGAFQLVDAGRAGLRELFPEDLVCTFGTDEEFRDKISYYLAHESFRKSLAERLRVLVSERHTYDRRVRRLINLLALSSAS